MTDYSHFETSDKLIKTIIINSYNIKTKKLDTVSPYRSISHPYKDFMKTKKKSSQHLIKPIDLTKNLHQIREQNVLNGNKGMQRAKSKLWENLQD